MRVHPHVELIAYTPLPEQVVAVASKLCYSDADIETLKQGVSEKDQARYLQRLIEMGHLSPVEHVSFTFGIEGVSRSFLAQITRHRIASFSVKSQRYVGAVHEAGTFNYVIPPSIEALGPDAVAKFEGQMAQMQQWYNEWAEQLGGTGESVYEDARFVLPNSAETKMIVTMNARELDHFFRLRCCNRAQWEIREVAWQMLRLCKQKAPALFTTAGPGCIAGSCPEGKKSCRKMKQVQEKYAQWFGGENGSQGKQ